MPEKPIPAVFDSKWTLILAGGAIFGAGLLTRGFLSRKRQNLIIASPWTTLLPRLSVEEQSQLPYPPDALPGARDVSSPYGTIRVYEWGPEEGRKVLLVHGISTPCLALGGVAHTLADNGCRVMLFDLFGRGYSDTPSELPHDIRLFTSQMLIVLASSALSWTGVESQRFALVGYSLGGGIAAGFASHFPTLVNNLVLIAPSGLIRPHHFSRTSRIIYSEGVIPETIINRAVKKRLQTPLYPNKKDETEPEENDVVAPIKAEINIESNQSTLLSKSHPNITIEAAVNHQVLNHEGFVTAFMSSIRNGPISDQHDNWRRIGQRLTQQKRLGKSGYDTGFLKGKVLVIGGAKDPIIKKDELEADAMEVFDGNAEFKFIDAGHEAPVAHGGVVGKLILEFWT